MERTWQWVADDGSVRVGVTTSRRDLTTSTVVISDGQALLVDPAWDADELAGIAADLTDLGVVVSAGFCTHAHHDHVLWHPGLGPAPRFASSRVADICARDRERIVKRLGPRWPVELAELVGRVAGTDGAIPDWPGVRLLTHDAHAPGHTALWLPAHGVLIAGDMLSNAELPLLEESTPAQYAAGLDLLRPYTSRASVLIPGHGRIAVGTQILARWRADRAYLDALLAGRNPADPRLVQPGMASAHAANLAAVHRRA